MLLALALGAAANAGASNKGGSAVRDEHWEGDDAFPLPHSPALSLPPVTADGDDDGSKGWTILVSPGGSW